LEELLGADGGPTIIDADGQLRRSCWTMRGQ
jgi:hypothetical protein